MEERISGVDDTIEEINSLVKENIKSKKFLMQTSRNLGHHEKTKRNDNRDRRRRKKFQLKGTENRLYQKMSPFHTKIKMQNIQNKERIFRAA